MKITSFLFVFVILGGMAFAQTSTTEQEYANKSAVFQAHYQGEKYPVSADLEWMSVLKKEKIKKDHSLPNKAVFDAMKAEKNEIKTRFDNRETGSDDRENTLVPIVETQFDGNPASGYSPLDNNIAISKDGIIISVANADVAYFNESGTNTFFADFTAMLDDPSIVSACDPLVHYDAEEDRFIMFSQECTGASANSFLLILFSKTNNPADGWHYYKITGNPLGDASWFDYPKMAVSEEELFVTGNLFYDSWEYNQPVIYQINKQNGYDGAELIDWQVWSSIAGSPSTILAIRSGSEDNYGPGLYFVSTNWFGSNAYNFYHITNTIGESPVLDYNSISTPSYEVSGDAEQFGTSGTLRTNDCRSLSGVYFDGFVHFVFHADAGGDGWASVIYNRLNVNTLENSNAVIGNVGEEDYAYPAIAPFNESASDQSVMIGFLNSGPDIFPGMAVVHCNDAMEWSEVTEVVEGTTYSGFGGVDRWGDYTGIARDYDSAEPVVWMNGMIANSSHSWETQIAKIRLADVTGLAENKVSNVGLTIAPNPTVDMFVLKFEMETPSNIAVKIWDNSGKLVNELYQGYATAGGNKFIFNKANLASGTYFVEIVNAENNRLAFEQLVIGQ